MIRYSLKCERGHEFESWFQDSASFDRQLKRKLVSCPACDSAKVEKAIMAPQVTRKGRSTRQRAREERIAAASATETPVPAAASSLPVPAALMSPEAQEFRAKLKELRDYIKTNADNVGEKFPEEARKMHYGETEHRPIYGEASPDDARALIEEGVEVLPIPALPDDRN
jgi:hypothetical protein